MVPLTVLCGDGCSGRARSFIFGRVSFLVALLLLFSSGVAMGAVKASGPSDDAAIAEIKKEIGKRLAAEARLRSFGEKLSDEAAAIAAQRKKLDEAMSRLYKDKAKLEVESARLTSEKERTKDKRQIDKIVAELRKKARAGESLLKREKELLAISSELKGLEDRIKSEKAALEPEMKMYGEESAQRARMRRERQDRLIALGIVNGRVGVGSAAGLSGAAEAEALGLPGPAGAAGKGKGELSKTGGDAVKNIAKAELPASEPKKPEPKKESKPEDALSGRTKGKTPEGVKADVVSPRQVDLSWDSFPEKGVAGYKIYRDGVFLKSVSGQSASLKDQEPGASHCYSITAVDEKGKELSGKKNVCAKTLTPDGEAPSPPLELVATGTSINQIDLSWGAANDNIGVTGYNVYKQGGLLSTVDETSALAKKLAPNTEYCFVVTAFDAVKNESPPSNKVCAKTPYSDVKRPTPPASLTASEVGVSEGGLSQIDLSWGGSADDTGVIGYNIYKDGVFLKAVSSTSAFKIDVKPDETHCFTISAKDSSGNESRRSRQVCTTNKRAGDSKSYGGTVWTGGINEFGQLGNGGNKPSGTLVMVKNMYGIIDVEAGVEHMAALKADGTVWTWGRNDKGQLGDGTNIDRYSPIAVQGLSGVTDIAAGMYHTLALKNDGTVWAWGRNYYGQIGDGTLVDRTAPTKVKGIGKVTAIAAGWYHSVALKKDGTVWAWGWNLKGQLGTADTENHKRPARADISDVELVAAGGEHTVALKTDGTVWAWGRNKNGQLGTGKISDALYPHQVQGIDDVEFVAAGADHTIALKADGTVWGWGGNEYGQLGRKKGVKYLTPALVEGIGQAKEVAAGAYHAVALRFDGSVWAWGWRMGDDYSELETAPSQISGLTGIVDIAAGKKFTAVLRGE